MFHKIFSSDRKTELESIEPKSWFWFSLLEKPKESEVVPIEEQLFAMRAVAWCLRHPNVEHSRGLHLWKPLTAVLSDSRGLGVISSEFKGKVGVPRPTDAPWAVLHKRGSHYWLSAPRQANLDEPHEPLEEWYKKWDYIDILNTIGIFVWADNTRKYYEKVTELMAMEPAERAKQTQTMYIEQYLKDAPVKPAKVELETDEPEQLLVKAINAGHGNEPCVIDLMRIEKWDFSVNNSGYQSKTQLVWDRNKYMTISTWKAQFKQFQDDAFQLVGFVNPEWIVTNQ
jgi:hypothetical protein